MARSALQYRQLLQNLLPRGRAWTRNNDSILSDVLYAFAEELSRFEGRIEDLLKEDKSSTITELLTEYESDFGIPEPFQSLGSTIEERRNDIHAKMIAVGSQDENYYASIALALGYTVFQDFFNPAIVGYFSSGSSCGPSENIFYWFVQVDANGDKGAFDWAFEPNAFYETAPNSFDFAHSMVRSYHNLWSEINRLKPAHIMALFDWYNRAYSRSFGWAFDCFPSYDGSVIPEGYNGAFDESFANIYDYDGEYLVGAFDTAFWLDYDGHFGWDFYKREFDSAFARPL